MLRIRLARRGAVHRPFYRVVVNDSALTPDSRNVEEIGYYDPRQSPPVLELDVEKAEGWIKKGAIPSPRVRAFIKKVKARPQAPEAARREAAPAEAGGKAPAESAGPPEGTAAPGSEDVDPAEKDVPKEREQQEQPS